MNDEVPEMDGPTTEEPRTALEEIARAASETASGPGPSAAVPGETASSLAEMAQAAVSVPKDELEEEIVTALQTIYDPEIPVNIHELGLIYGIAIDDGGNVEVRMTLTAPGCPVAGPLMEEVEFKVAAVPGVATARVELVWEPPWTMERMSEAARLSLGMF